ncbi:MAG TPA: hypothetical protein VK843_03340 [Planctomycetota bacterium]|nr:hypothetical protein [Planctomycetota bacterium]
MNSNPQPIDAERREPKWLATCQLAGLWLIAVIGAAAVFRVYHDFIFEDAYITYRYARNIAAGLGFVFQEGERVLGTMPLYTLVLAVGNVFGADIPTLSGLLYSASIAAIAILGGTMLRRLGSPNAALLFATACVCGFTQCLNYFGIETPFITALMLAAVLAVLSQRDVLAGVFAALAFLTRYDAALFAILLFLALWMKRRRIPWDAGLVASGIVLPWMLFARIYFGSWTPNTLAAKAGSVDTWDYLVRSALIQALNVWTPLQKLGGDLARGIGVWRWANYVVLAGALVLLVRLWRGEKLYFLLIAYPIALWVGYAFVAPPLGFSWYLIPASYMLLLAGIAGWSLVLRRPPWIRARGLAALAIAVVALFLQPRTLAKAESSITDTMFTRARVGAYATIADWILANDLGELKLLTLEPGYLTYHSGNPVIDGAGLVTAGVHFFGPKRTEFTELIEAHKPPLIVAQIPFRHVDYVVAYSTFPFFQLMLRREDNRRLFDSLASSFADAGMQPRPDLLRHPFELDVRAVSSVIWPMSGGEVLYVGQLYPLTIDGAPVPPTDAYLFVPGPSMGAETPPFSIDFDRLAFRFKADDGFTTVVQLVIDGKVVLQETGDPDSVASTEFPELSWSVRAWRGRTAQLRFVNMSNNGARIAADHIRSVSLEKLRSFDDFEAADGFAQHWRNPSVPQPTDLSDVARDFGVEFQVSGHAATTYGAAGLHRLNSKPFVIDADRLSFLMFDFGGGNTHVRLLVDKQPVRSVTGRGTGKLKSFTWDLRDLRGKEAVLQLIDMEPDTENWIGIDDVYLFDGR